MKAIVESISLTLDECLISSFGLVKADITIDVRLYEVGLFPLTVPVFICKYDNDLNEKLHEDMVAILFEGLYQHYKHLDYDFSEAFELVRSKLHDVLMHAKCGRGYIYTNNFINQN